MIKIINENISWDLLSNKFKNISYFLPNNKISDFGSKFKPLSNGSGPFITEHVVIDKNDRSDFCVFGIAIAGDRDISIHENREGDYLILYLYYPNKWHEDISTKEYKSFNINNQEEVNKIIEEANRLENEVSKLPTSGSVSEEYVKFFLDNNITDFTLPLEVSYRLDDIDFDYDRYIKV